MDKELINEIIKSVNIVDIISKYIPLVKKGKNHFCVCPFHDDDNPSMSVSNEKQIYSCFSCHASGNVITFLMNYEKITFLEALKILADTTGHKINIKTTEKPITKINEIYNLANKFYINNLNTNLGAEAKKYLYQRNISEDIIKEFQIGLSLKQTNTLSNVLLQKNYSETDLLNSTLIVKNEKGYHDFFINRIMFPLYDETNNVIGYSGRIYTDDPNPKYINSKEHQLFKKSNFLYNYYKAKNECRIKNSVILTEGFMDVIRCHSIGVKNVVATMGTAFTKQHVNMLKKLSSNIIISYDGDNAGIKAVISCADILISSNIIPKVIILENDLDPDEYILKYGETKFKEKINNPISIMDFKLKYYKNNIDFNSPTDKANYVKIIINELNNINDEILREITLEKLSIETNLSKEFLNSKIQIQDIKHQVIQKKIKTNKYEIAEKELLFYMLNNEEAIKKTIKSKIIFQSKQHRILSAEIISFYKNNNYINQAELINNIPNNVTPIFSQILNQQLEEKININIIDDYIAAIKEKVIKEEINNLTNKLNLEQNHQNKILISQKILELIRRKNE